MTISAFLRYCRLTVAVLVAAAVGSVLSGCHHAELWEELPPDISSFISQYFPNSELNSYTHTGTTYHVRIDDGPGLTFDADYKWTDINGYGMPLPQVLLFDQLPPKIYDYLQETEQLNAVFALSRDSARYTLTLLDQTLTYDIATATISGSKPEG